MTVGVSEKRSQLQFAGAGVATPATYAVVTMFAGGLSLFSILFVLCTTTIRWSMDGVAPSYEQLVRHTQLFHTVFPSFAALSPTSFAYLAWSCVVGMWAVFLNMIWKLREHPIDHRLVFGGAIALGIMALMIAPVFSTDPFSYAMFGKIAGVYHHNPYLSTPRIVAPDDPLMAFLYWRDIPSPYGPLWTMVSAVIAAGQDTPPLVLMLRFKAVGLLEVLLDGWLIYTLVRRRWPEQAGWAYLAFAWNPLVLIEGVIIGHNDVFILLLVLGSACLLAQARPVLSVAGLTASALIKYSTVPMIGLTGLRLLAQTPWRGRPLMAARLALTVFAVAAACFFPFWTGYQSLTSTVNEPGRGLNNPILRALCWLLSVGTGGWFPAHNPGTAVLLAAVLFCGWQLVYFWRTRGDLVAWTIHDEMAAWCASATAFLILWPRTHTWYFLLPLGLSLALDPIRRRSTFWVVVALTIGSYSSYFW